MKSTVPALLAYKADVAWLMAINSDVAIVHSPWRRDQDPFLSACGYAVHEISSEICARIAALLFTTDGLLDVTVSSKFPDQPWSVKPRTRWELTETIHRAHGEYPYIVGTVFEENHVIAFGMSDTSWYVTPASGPATIAVQGALTTFGLSVDWSSQALLEANGPVLDLAKYEYP